MKAEDFFPNWGSCAKPSDGRRPLLAATYGLFLRFLMDVFDRSRPEERENYAVQKGKG